MKRCPTCHRTYADDQNFCLDDGTTLASDPSGGYDSGEPPTINYPYRGNAAPTEMMRGAAPTAGGGAPYTMPPPGGGAPPPPPPYAPAYGAQAQAKRSPVPWIVGGVLVLALGIGAIVFLTSRGESKNTNNTNTTSGTTTNTSNTTTTTNSTSTSYASWEEVTGDGFSFSMPGKPQKTEQTVPSAGGPLPIQMYTLSKGFEGFITGYSEYPDAVFQSGSPEQLLDLAQQGAVSNVNGTVTNQRSITNAGYPGREIVGASPGQNISFTARVYLAKPRMYMLVYTQYGKDKPISEDGRRFMESFQITK